MMTRRVFNLLVIIFVGVLFSVIPSGAGAMVKPKNVSGKVVKCGTSVGLGKVAGAVLVKKTGLAVGKPFKTDTDGSFSFDLPAGVYILVIFLNGKESKAIEFTVKEQELVLEDLCL